MEEAAALVAERRAQEAADAEKARVARLEKARKMAAAEEAEGLRIIYADFANAMRVGDFGKIYTFIDRFRLDINWEDTYGNTPLIAACRYGLRVPIMKLCRRGAEPDYENQFGMTALIEACRGGHSQLLPLLMFDDQKRPRCSVDLVNKWGKTARDYAIECGHSIKILPLLDASLADQQKALDNIFGGKKDEKKKEKKERKPFPNPVKIMKHHLLLPYRKYKVWHYKKYEEATVRENAALFIQRFFRRMISKQTAQRDIQQMIAKVIKENLRLKKMNFFIVKLQRIFRGKRARLIVAEMRRRQKAAVIIQALWRSYIYRKKFMAVQLERRRKEKLHRMAKRIQAMVRRKLEWLHDMDNQYKEECAVIIQKYIRVKLARMKVKVMKWEREHKIIIEKLEATIVPLLRIATANRIKHQVASGLKIKNWIREKHRLTLKMALYRRLVARRKWAATLIQRHIRGHLARALRDRREAYRRQHINGLPSVLLVKKLGTGHGMGNSYRIGHPDKYGYCSKEGCNCNKYGVADSTKPLICYCGHFITNHVVGIFRDSDKEDYYIANKPKRTTMSTRFHMATGVEKNYDSFYKFLRRSMTSKDLRQSLNASKAPVQLSLEIRKPSVTNLQKYIRKKLTSPRFLVGVDVKDTESPKERKERFIREHVERIRGQREKQKLGKKKEGGFDPVPKKIRTGLFKPQMITAKDRKIILSEEEKDEVKFVELQAKSSMERTSKRISNIKRLDQEIKLTEANIKKIKQQKNFLKKKEKRLKVEAKADQEQYKLKIQMHFKSLELEEMKKRPFKNAHTQLMEEHVNILQERKKRISFAGIDYGLDDIRMTPDEPQKEPLASTKEKIIKDQTPPSTASTAEDYERSGNVSEGKPNRLPNRGKHVRKKVVKAKSSAEKKNDRGETGENGANVVRGLFKGLSDTVSFSSKGMDKKRNARSERKRKVKAKKRRVDKKADLLDTELYEDDFHPYTNLDEPRKVPKYETVVEMLKGMVENMQNTSAAAEKPYAQIVPQNQSIQEYGAPMRKHPVSEILPRVNDGFSKPLSSENGFKTKARWTRLPRDNGNMRTLTPDYVKVAASKPSVKTAAKTPDLAPPKEPMATLELIVEGDKDRFESDARLESYHSKEIPKILKVFEGRTVVGREMGCDIVLDSKIQSKMISKVHAMIYGSYDDEGNAKMHLVDCNSTNGSYVNGQRVSIARVSILDGATIMFGRKSRKREKRSELIYQVTLHKKIIEKPATPVRPMSTKLYSYGAPDNDSNYYASSANINAYRTMRLPATPETSEMQWTVPPLEEPFEEDRKVSATVPEPRKNFPSMLVVRAPSRGSLLHSTDDLLSKAWPKSNELNWVVRGSSRHGRVRRRLVRTNPAQTRGHNGEFGSNSPMAGSTSYQDGPNLMQKFETM